MELMEVITTKKNLNRAYKKVVENKGANLDKLDKELEQRGLRFVR